MNSNAIMLQKPKTQGIVEKCGKYLHKFLTETTLHSLKYVGNNRLTIWERLYYLTWFILVVIVAYSLSIDIFDKWQTTPVIIGMESHITPIQTVPFPAITICNMNQARRSKVSKISPDSLDYIMLLRSCFEDFNYGLYRNATPRYHEDTFVNFLVNNGQPCKDMIPYCKYGTGERNCTDLFREVLLDEGLCCAFNILHPFFLYKGEYKFVRDYTTTHGRIPVDWSPETGYAQQLPRYYYPRTAEGAGVSLGLTIVLNAELDDYYCSTSNSAGFKIILHNPIDTPLIRDTGLPVMIGQQSRFRIGTTSFEALPSVRSIPPNERLCYFNDEKTLHYFRYYTRRNCELECDTKFMLRSCNCIPYHMPLLFHNATICFVNHFECVADAEKRGYDYASTLCKKKCLPSCFEQMPYAELFATPFAARDYMLHDQYFRNLPKDYVHKNLALVQFFYKESFYRSYVKTPYITFTDFLSQTGGIMSLMMGFSVISIAEFFYFFMIRPIFDYILKRAAPEVIIACDSEDSSDDDDDNDAGDNYYGDTNKSSTLDFTVAIPPANTIFKKKASRNFVFHHRREPFGRKSLIRD